MQSGLAPLVERHCCENGRSEWRFQQQSTSGDLTTHGIEIRDCGTGMGIFAIKAFQPGDCIFSERPLLQWTSAGQAERNFYGWLVQSIQCMPLEDQAAYIALHASPAFAHQGPAMAIWRANAFNKGDGTDAVAIFRIISRFNHACSANCATHWSRYKADTQGLQP